MSNPLISIVIPAYNLPDYTEKTIDSIVAQTYRPIEIVISDDNSPNSLKDLVDRKKIETDLGSNIKYFRQKTNLNHYWNLEFTLSQATGKYIVLLDHDDWFIDSDFLRESLNAIKSNSNCFMAIANSIIENSPHTAFSLNFNHWHFVNGPDFMKNYLYTTVHPFKSTVMLCFDTLKKLKYWNYYISQESAKEMKIMPDEAFILICLLASHGNIALTGKVVCVHGMPPISLSRSTGFGENKGQEMFIQHFLLYSYFKKTGCTPAAQAMLSNLVERYPCERVNIQMIRYLNSNKTAILFMVLGVFKYNLARIRSLPIKVIRRLRVVIGRLVV